MSSLCAACAFSGNAESADVCEACGAELQDIEQPPTSATTTDVIDDEADVRVVVVELPPKEKLGMKLIPPSNGVVDHGLGIDHISNPLLENKVMAGDLIVAIGGQSVDQMAFSDAIDLIRKLPRPLAISFEIDKARRQQMLIEKMERSNKNDLGKQLTTYAVVFDGPMGLNLEEGVRYGIDGAVVRALKGQARTSGMITVGDIVFMVNETEVLCMPYVEVMMVVRNAATPRTLQFVPKTRLADVQRMNSQKMMKDPHVDMDKGQNGGADDNKPIAQLIMDNLTAIVRKGCMYKQGRLMRTWESRYFVLSLSKIANFKSPSSTTSRGEMSFLDHRGTVRSLPGSQDIVSKSPHVLAEYLLELRVGDRRLVLACTSESDKKGWMEAIKLAIDASRTVNGTQNLSESLHKTESLLAQPSGSISVGRSFMNINANGRLSQLDNESFSTPVVHVTVVSATNLTQLGSTVNAMCEVTVGGETFMTAVIKGQRSPVWKQENYAAFEALSDEMVVEVRVFNERFFRSEMIAALTISLKSLPNMEISEDVPSRS